MHRSAQAIAAHTDTVCIPTVRTRVLVRVCTLHRRPDWKVTRSRAARIHAHGDSRARSLSGVRTATHIHTPPRNANNSNINARCGRGWLFTIFRFLAAAPERCRGTGVLVERQLVSEGERRISPARSFRAAFSFSCFSLFFFCFAFGRFLSILVCWHCVCGEAWIRRSQRRADYSSRPRSKPGTN